MPTTLAVFSDVHANLPALEAVLSDLDARLGRGEVDAVYCLGDLVGYATWPNEVVLSIQERGVPTIAGNYDEGVGLNSDDCGCAYQTDEDKARGAESIAYTNEAVTEATRRYLRGLPRHLRLTFEAPRDRKAGADVMLFGHTHKPYYKVLESEHEGTIRHAVNTGSVGKPKDGDPRAGYVLLTIDPERGKGDAGYCRVEHVRVGYDVEAAARAVEASPLADALADMLRKAY